MTTKRILGPLRSLNRIPFTPPLMAEETRGLLARTGAPAIAKPFQADELMATIEKVLRGRAE